MNKKEKIQKSWVPFKKRMPPNKVVDNGRLLAFGPELKIGRTQKISSILTNDGRYLSEAYQKGPLVNDPTHPVYEYGYWKSTHWIVFPNPGREYSRETRMGILQASWERLNSRQRRFKIGEVPFMLTFSPAIKGLSILHYYFHINEDYMKELVFPPTHWAPVFPPEHNEKSFRRRN